MITNRQFWTVACVLGLVGLAGSSAAAWRVTTRSAPHSHAAWAFVADSPEMLVHNSHAIVVAEAVATYPGRIATSESGEDVLPFEIVEFQVRNSLKGSFPDGRIYVERAGGTEPETGIHHAIDIDGGEYEAGRTYLLFLNEQPGDTGLYYQINDQGRYELAGSRLRSIEREADRVQQFFEERKMTEAIALIRQMAD